MPIDDIRATKLINNFPKNVNITLSEHQYVQRQWMRNWHATLIAGSFLFCVYQYKKIFHPYKNVPLRTYFRAQPDYANSLVTFQKTTRDNTLGDF